MSPKKAPFHSRSKRLTSPQSKVMAFAAPPAMKLTYDIFLHVISLLSFAKDAVHLMATCRVLYRAGAQIALRKPVILQDSYQLYSFLEFLDAENFFRCRHLRQLELWSCGEDEDDIDRLIEILPRLVNLEALRLSDPEYFFGSDQALPQAFAALRSLRYIELPGIEKATLVLLDVLRSPLTSATIDFITTTGSDVWGHLHDSQWAEFHPMTLLQNFTSTLEELNCGGWIMVTEPVIPKMPIYPNMRKLSLEAHDAQLRMDPFIRAFPNLSHLHVYAGESHSFVGEVDLETIRASYDINVEKQSMPSGRWAHLEQFTGGLADLYATGLTCPIRRITIMDSLEDEPAADILETMLRYARPAHLKLEGLASSLLGDADRGFLSMLRDDSECTSNLINLAMRICFDANVGEKDLMTILDNLVLALTSLRLKFLELTLDTSCDLDPFSRLQDTLQWMMVHYDGRMPESYGQDPIPLTPVEVALSSLDVDALLSRLESIPSLEVALVVLKPSRNIDRNIERTFTKSSSTGLAGPEQWRSWLPGKTPFTQAL